MRNNLKGIMLASLVLIIVGLIFIFNSSNFGSFAANSLAFSEGDSVDTTYYNIVLKNSMSNFRSTGLVMLTVGMLTAVMSYFKWINIPKKD